MSDEDRKLRVVVVDDSSFNRQTIVDILEPPW